jgi:uncharacterized protein
VKTLFILLMLMLGCNLVFAQKPPARPRSAKPQAAAKTEQPSTEQVLKLLDMMQVRDNLQITLDAMKTQMKSGAEQMLREKIPVPTAEQLKSVSNIIDEAFGDLSMDDLIRDIVPVYQKHLTRSDVAALISFYSSPVGQKLRREQGPMMRESMQATAAGQQEKMELLLDKVETRIQQLIQTEQNKP